ncbi:hypothetical protein [Terriglobus sp. RCC_193]|uniref:hypothetical protein n=1 Tax=Terriglobus sp. RCC_193 TaxID=3239218 RepID=UPI0035261614
MASASQTFVQLWGVYVSGFKPDKHCIYCLKGKKELQLHREMQDGNYTLKTDSPYFYLFAMGRVPKHETNVHLAVRPQAGSVASIGSVYGVTFTIRDAFALRVDRLPDGWMGLGTDYTRCRNFQFGVQQFGYRPMGSPQHPGDHSLIPEKLG